MKSVQKILDQNGSVALPGVYDTLSALIAERVGFPLGFISGYSVAATSIGEPDLGLLTQTEMIERARSICSRVSIPIIVDADTGYGNPLNVYRTVNDLIAAGAKGCFFGRSSLAKTLRSHARQTHRVSRRICSQNQSGRRGTR